MEERDAVMTPRAAAPPFTTRNAPKDPIPSSSPAFATPAYPIASRPAKDANRPLPQAFAKPTTPAVLPVLLPPAILRPLAFRTITKKHNLTITSSSLQLLANFIGRHCGSGWREEGLAERVLDEVAKAWKRSSGGVILDDTPEKKLADILKQLESCMTGGRVDAGRLSRSGSDLEGNFPANRPPPAGREQSQISLSGLDVDDDLAAANSDEETSPSKQDARPYLKAISAFAQPRLIYSTTKKSLEVVTTKPSLFPPPSHKTTLFRNRYNLIHQRLMRNESFQTPSFSTTAKGNNRSLQRSTSTSTTIQQAYKITPIANLLGRSGSSHLLLGLLAIAPTTGELALTDLTGSITLDLSSARPIPEDGAWFCPGMIVLIEGLYEEDGSNTGGGVGGMIGGRFFGTSIGGPPAERRDVTLGITSHSQDGNPSILSAGAGFGWVDFLGVGSERAQGQAMRTIQQRILGNRRNDDDTNNHTAAPLPPRRTKIAILGECQLDNPRTLEAIRQILLTYSTTTPSTASQPLCIIFMGNFVSSAYMSGADPSPASIEYKEHFDGLASILSEFPSLLSRTTLLFVPGDHDLWPSAFSAGAATPIPRGPVPDIFTSRIRRAVHAANIEAGRVEGTGEAIWTSNPARLSVFGPVEDIVLFRDDVTGRLRRGAVTFQKPGEGDMEEEEEEEEEEPMQEEEDGERAVDHASSHHHHTTGIHRDRSIQAAESHLPSGSATTFRKLTKTLLDQAHLSPFPLSSRPVLWDYGSSLDLYPLPTALILTDAEAGAFAITYEGCHVMNAGRVVDEVLGMGSGGGGGGGRAGTARWVEYDVGKRRGEVRELRY